MKRILYLAASAVTLLMLIWLFAPAVRLGVVGMASSRGREGITLSVVSLKSNEQIAIAYRSIGCFHFRERLYQVTGGEVRQFLAAKLRPGQLEEGESFASERMIGTKKMHLAEAIGLDSYLLFLGGTTTEDARPKMRLSWDTIATERESEKNVSEMPLATCTTSTFPATASWCARTVVRQVSPSRCFVRSSHLGY